MSAVSHVVLVEWKTDRQDLGERLVRDAIRGFVDTVPGVQAVVEGPSVSPEGLEGGFGYGFVVTFVSPGARDAYLDHPAHRPVAEAIREHSARIVVFDMAVDAT